MRTSGKRMLNFAGCLKDVMHAKKTPTQPGWTFGIVVLRVLVHPIEIKKYQQEDVIHEN
jgi:hypothetical protein